MKLALTTIHHKHNSRRQIEYLVQQ